MKKGGPTCGDRGMGVTWRYNILRLKVPFCSHGPLVPWASYSNCMRSNVARRDITMPRTVPTVHLRYSWPIRSKRNSLWHPYLCLGFLFKRYYITELKTNGKRVSQRHRYSARCDLPFSVSGGFGPQDNLTVPCWAPTWIKSKENINTCTRK